MITKDDIKELLSALKFKEIDGVFTKMYEGISVPFKVDVNKEHFYYKEIGITVGRETTSNFSEPENFVVFECVDRLLAKGYKPDDIELEPSWKLGRTTKGGYADIWVRTHNSFNSEIAEDKESLIIIECKRADEFDGAWKDTLEDGAQLFSYFQQEQATKFLCLYTSDISAQTDISEKEIRPSYYLVNVQDNEQKLKNNPGLLAYKDAKNNKQLFRVWHDTYQCDVATRGLFEDDMQAYHIGKNKFSVKDLAPISNEEIKKKYNEFATILRRHNVGARENAFDKLVNLFLAKVVDETNNPNDLHFYWKGSAYDDDYSLQDRLQRLYRDGMEKFLNENVTYIENEQIEKAFRWYKKDPDATMKTVLEYFRALKFYSDNDFSFISVHNERLFKENAKILLEVLQMLQNIKLKSTSEEGSNTETNQFLGDLFEGFLTKGVKQSEGQYFTPMPIVRFIVSSLPLEHIVSQSERIPSCIDYACGAGHFLTEYATRIKEFVKKHRPDIDIHEYYKQITGIEKEYRLSKVSKVSAFMYGHDETNIVYADALKPHAVLQPNSYDVLVANPPYAVTGFLETLDENERNAFSLFNNNISLAKNKAIETFFIERSAQLMRTGGIAGIVLPISILKNGGIYAQAREIILEKFDIISLVEFGDGTFGKTGTSTVVLFLRRKETSTPAADHYRNRVKTWFATGDNAEDIYQDECLLQAYCEHCGYDLSDYRTLLKEGVVTESLAETEIFKTYRESFDSTDHNAMKGVCDTAKGIRNRFRSKSKTKAFHKLKETERETYKRIALRDFIIAIEQEKVYIFLLVFTLNTPILIVKSPIKTAAVKKFLGYQWSESKGNEGIEYLHLSKSKSENDDEGDEDDTVQQIRGINGIVTPLFNPVDLEDPEKINTLIRKNFLGEDVVIPEELAEFVSQVRLVDMIDFKQTAFDKAIKTRGNLREPIKEFGVNLQYEPLKNVAPIVSDKIDFSTIISSEYITTDNILQNFEGVEPYKGSPIQGKVNRYQKGDILMSNIRPYLKKIWISNRNGGCSSDVLVFRPSTNIAPSYVGCVLQRQAFVNFVMADIKGLKMPRGNKSNIERYLIPIPSLKIQKTIISECEELDKEIREIKNEADKSKKQIIDIINSIQGKPEKLSDVCVLNEFSINPLQTPEQQYLYVDIDAIENGTGVIRFDKKIIGKNAPSRARRLAKEGSTLISTVRPNLCGFAYLDSEHPDAIYSTGLAIIRSKDTERLLNKMIYLYFMYDKGLMSQMINAMPKGSYPSINQSDINNLILNIPTLVEQEKIVKKVSIYEKQISRANRIINSAGGRKQAILDKYLKDNS